MSYFPVINGSTSSSATGTNTHVVSMPSSIVAGELLVVFFATASQTVNTPSGWTKRGDQLCHSGNRRLVVYTRVATGSDSLTVTTSGSTDSGHTAYRVETNNDLELAFASSTTNQITADPPNLTPSGGSQKYVWIAASNGYGPLAGYPSGYSSNQLTAGANIHYVASASYQNEASSENPSTFTWNTSDSWVAVTVALQEKTPVVGSHTTLNMVGSPYTPSISYGATATTPVLGMTASIYPTSRTSYERTKWTTTTKS